MARLIEGDSSSMACTAVVVWGTNFTSSVGFHRFSKLISSTVSLPPNYMGVCVGLLLSDGWLSGIMDADCGFYLNWKLDKKGLPTSLVYYMRLSQKQTYQKILYYFLPPSSLDPYAAATPPYPHHIMM